MNEKAKSRSFASRQGYNDPLPIARYTGLDVDPTVIDFLKSVVTAFLDLHSDGGYGFIDRFSTKAGWSAKGMAKGGYLDVYPDDPLAVTLYDRDYAVSLLAQAGWRVDNIRDPTPAAQHTLVATPILTHAT